MIPVRKPRLLGLNDCVIFLIEFMEILSYLGKSFYQGLYSIVQSSPGDVRNEELILLVVKRSHFKGAGTDNISESREGEGSEEKQKGDARGLRPGSQGRGEGGEEDKDQEAPEAICSLLVH